MLPVTFYRMSRSIRSGRLSALCCLLAAIVALAPSLPCMLMCASKAHQAQMQHMHGHGMAAPDQASMPCNGEHLPAPLASVVTSLAATTMLPPTLAPQIIGAVGRRTDTLPQGIPPLAPRLLPEPPPPRLS